MSAAIAPSAGHSVLVRWADGNEYPAQVVSVQGDQVLCRFPNGSESWIGAAFVRLNPSAGRGVVAGQSAPERAASGAPARIMAIVLLLIGGPFWGLLLTETGNCTGCRQLHEPFVIGAACTMLLGIAPTVFLAHGKKRPAGTVRFVWVCIVLVVGLMALTGVFIAI